MFFITNFLTVNRGYFEIGGNFEQEKIISLFGNYVTVYWIQRQIIDLIIFITYIQPVEDREMSSQLLQFVDRFFKNGGVNFVNKNS